jgi:acyl-CoA reductase-like NAD-dependent aldehyde dehydrogenase
LSTSVWKVDNPYDGSIYCEVPLATEQKTKQVVSKAQQTFQSWRNTSVNDRIALAKK